jgi:rhamnogalacturonan acetylesterase
MKCLKGRIRQVYRVSILVALFVAGASFAPFLRKPKPTLFLIGDSTVRNSDKEQWGWGSLLHQFLDTGNIKIANHAMAGRSSRSFTTEGRFAKVVSLLQPGDYLLIQFGHNDGSYPDTTAKNRGTLKGTGEDTVVLKWKHGRREVVHSYGWYIRQFVRQAKASGAQPVILSMVPRNIFKEGKVPRANMDFGKWAKEVAQQEGVPFLDLNEQSAKQFEKLGADKVGRLFYGDHTHTNKDGARLNAASVMQLLASQEQLGIKKAIRKKELKKYTASLRG